MKLKQDLWTKDELILDFSSVATTQPKNLTALQSSSYVGQSPSTLNDTAHLVCLHHHWRRASCFGEMQELLGIANEMSPGLKPNSKSHVYFMQLRASSRKSAGVISSDAWRFCSSGEKKGTGDSFWQDSRVNGKSERENRAMKCKTMAPAVTCSTQCKILKSHSVMAFLLYFSTSGKVLVIKFFSFFSGRNSFKGKCFSSMTIGFIYFGWP